MPWCDECSRFWTPTSMEPDGSCPACGDVIADPTDARAPWHFKLLLASVVLYLGWRAAEGVVWVLRHV